MKLAELKAKLQVLVKPKSSELIDVEMWDAADPVVMLRLGSGVRYVAAVNPATALKLVELLEECQRHIRVRALSVGDDYHNQPCPDCSLLTRLDGEL